MKRSKMWKTPIFNRYERAWAMVFRLFFKSRLPDGCLKAPWSYHSVVVTYSMEVLQNDFMREMRPGLDVGLEIKFSWQPEWPGGLWILIRVGGQPGMRWFIQPYYKPTW